MLGIWHEDDLFKNVEASHFVICFAVPPLPLVVEAADSSLEHSTLS